jgi:hypothetical protein
VWAESEKNKIFFPRRKKKKNRKIGKKICSLFVKKKQSMCSTQAKEKLMNHYL